MVLYSKYSYESKCPKCGNTVYVNASEGICHENQVMCADCRAKEPESEGLKELRERIKRGKWNDNT